MPRLSLLCVLLCLLAIGVPGLEAGVVIVSDHETLLEPKSSSTHKVYIDKDRMRIESSGTTGGQTIVFRQDQGKFWIIDPTSKTYTELAKQDLQNMQETMAGAMSMMQEHMKELPPEQRKMVEQMMQGKMQATTPETPKKAPKTVYKKVASGEKVNRWVCDKYVGNARDKEEVWTTDWNKAGVTTEDLKVMQHIGEFFAGLSRQQPFMTPPGIRATEEEQGFPGLPIRTLHYSGPQVRTRMEITDIQRQDLAASLFELPSGLQKKALQ